MLLVLLAQYVSGWSLYCTSSSCVVGGLAAVLHRSLPTFCAALIFVHILKSADNIAGVSVPVWVSGLWVFTAYGFTFATGYVGAFADAGAWAFIVFFGGLYSFFSSFFKLLVFVLFGIGSRVSITTAVPATGVASLYSDCINSHSITFHIIFAILLVPAIVVHWYCIHRKGVSSVGVSKKASDSAQLFGSTEAVEVLHWAVVGFLFLELFTPFYLKLHLGNNVSFSGFTVKAPNRILTDFLLSPFYLFVKGVSLKGLLVSVLIIVAFIASLIFFGSTSRRRLLKFQLFSFTCAYLFVGFASFSHFGFRGFYASFIDFFQSVFGLDTDFSYRIGAILIGFLSHCAGVARAFNTERLLTELEGSQYAALVPRLRALDGAMRDFNRSCAALLAHVRPCNLVEIAEIRTLRWYMYGFPQLFEESLMRFAGRRTESPVSFFGHLWYFVAIFFNSDLRNYTLNGQYAVKYFRDVSLKSDLFEWLEGSTSFARAGYWDSSVPGKLREFQLNLEYLGSLLRDPIIEAYFQCYFKLGLYDDWSGDKLTPLFDAISAFEQEMLAKAAVVKQPEPDSLAVRIVKSLDGYNTSDVLCVTPLIAKAGKGTDHADRPETFKVLTKEDLPTEDRAIIEKALSAVSRGFAQFESFDLYVIPKLQLLLFLFFFLSSLIIVLCVVACLFLSFHRFRSNFSRNAVRSVLSNTAWALFCLVSLVGFIAFVILLCG